MTRGNVVACALAASPFVAAEQHTLTSVAARRQSARLLLPSNPTLALTAARRDGGGTSVFNWSATLSQEIELSGQRGARVDVADAEHASQRARVVVARRDVAADVLVAYFDAIAAAEEKRLADRLVQVGDALSAHARARASSGVGSEMDADLAGAASTRLLVSRSAAERRATATMATVASLLGADPTQQRIAIEGDLTPLAVVNADVRALSDGALQRRGEVAATSAERRANQSRADLYRRLRAPNPIVSIFVQNDGFNERVLGLGLTLPIPLARSQSGPIAESEALAERASSEEEQWRRQIRLEVAKAYANVSSRKREVEAFDAERLRRVEESLRGLTRELDAARVSIRDALLAQQTFVEMLQAHVEAKKQLCLASVELARAAGIALDGGPL